jgi:predicted acetyltransferase
VFPLFPESYEISVTRPSKGMNRILNALKAFELMKTPETPGKANIRVADKFMPCNDGAYALEWENGRMTSVKRNTGEVDLETDIETLVQLMTGFIDMDGVRLKRGVNIKGNVAVLKALFPIKDMIMMDSF